MIIVDFKVGTTEDHARAAVTRIGGTVKRRMRSDDPTRVRLLVDGVEEKAIAREPGVERTEVDGDNYRAS